MTGSASMCLIENNILQIDPAEIRFTPVAINFCDGNVVAGAVGANNIGFCAGLAADVQTVGYCSAAGTVVGVHILQEDPAFIRATPVADFGKDFHGFTLLVCTNEHIA